MTNEEKVEQYFQEIEKVFGTKESTLNFLNNYDKHSIEDKERLNTLMLGRHQKTYKLEVKVDEPNILNNWVMTWLYSANNGGSIAGVKMQAVHFFDTPNKEFINEMEQLIQKYKN
jgi:hypothetical protein